MIYQIDKLKRQIQHCCRCRRSETRLQAVPGEGQISADIMLLGEAPGKEENKTGRPFVGRAGTYLEKIFSQYQLDRSWFWITSILKCFHPETPEKGQIEKCRRWTLRQIDVLKPQIIFIMGRWSEWGLLGKRVNKAESPLISWNGLPCIVTCHPAAAMRFPQHDQQFKNDFKILMDFAEKMGISFPGI